MYFHMFALFEVFHQWLLSLLIFNQYVTFASASPLPAGLNSLGVSQQQDQAGSPGKDQEKEGLCAIWLGLIKRNKISLYLILKF